MKANAYGHGVVFVSAAVEELVDCFGVARLEESLKFTLKWDYETYFALRRFLR